MAKRGDIALCGMGCLGLILYDFPQPVIYKDGNRGMAYIGIQLTNKISSVGSGWSSRHPTVVGHVDDMDSFLSHLEK